MKRFLGFIDRIFRAFGQWLQSPLLLLLRLYFGIAFILAGVGKFQDIDKFKSLLTSLHIAYPEIAAWAVAFTETIGGALLVIGLLSRFASFSLTVVMCMAYATVHVDAIYSITKDPQLFISQAPFNFLLTTLLVLAFGPGFFSLDRWISGSSTVKPAEIKK